jgi:hypothetical protein
MLLLTRQKQTSGVVVVNVLFGAGSGPAAFREQGRESRHVFALQTTNSSNVVGRAISSFTEELDPTPSTAMIDLPS